MKNILIISQARMASSRLPGKVLRNVFGKPLLWYLMERLKLVKKVNRILIATGSPETNQPIIDFAKEQNIDYFIGNEDDVLDRYYQAAKHYKGNIIVRITSDCPLMDPDLIDQGLEMFLNGNYAYISNGHPPTYPDGFDIEIFSFKALETAWMEAKLPSEREHVTLYIRDKKNDFKRNNFENDKNYEEYRLTVDTKEDFALISKIIENFYDQWETFTVQDVVKLMEQNPRLKQINIQYKRNERL